jgi:hypothetical protein
MPTNFVYDLKIHPRENELIVATHGRGIFIADITSLQGLTADALGSEAALLDVQPVVRWVRGQTNATAALNFSGRSRPAGVTIHYYLRSAGNTATVRVYDGTRVIAELAAPSAAGVNTVRWNMQAGRQRIPGEPTGRGGRGGFGGRGRGGRGGGAGGAPVPVFPVAAPDQVLAPAGPGTYRVVLSVGGRDYEKAAVILEDVWY